MKKKVLVTNNLTIFKKKKKRTKTGHGSQKFIPAKIISFTQRFTKINNSTERSFPMDLFLNNGSSFLS